MFTVLHHFIIITLAILFTFSESEITVREKRQLFPGSGCMDYCSMGISFCQHGGVCQMDPNDCKKMYCICPADYTGDYCHISKGDLTTTQSNDTTVALSSSGSNTVIPETSTIDPADRMCSEGFECVHGICDQEAKMNNNFRCTCEEGWTGLFCSEKVSREKECFPGFVCVNGYCNIIENSMKCVCDDGWTGNLCSEPVIQHTSTTSVISMEARLSTVTPPSKETPTCAMICFNGQCDGEFFRDTGFYRCKCDPGYIGDVCIERCDLDCGEHGVCRKSESIGMFCTCLPRYSGERCQLLTSDHHHTNNSSSHKTDAPCSLTCENNGICVNVNGMVKCECRAGYSGDHCGDKVTQNKSCGFFNCQHGECDEEFYREQNGLKCKCYEGFVGELCQTKCELDCGPNGLCAEHLDGDTFCTCHPSWGGVNCSQYTANITVGTFLASIEEPVWHWYIVGTCLVVLAILVVLLVILPYILWKKRVFFIMKIIYYLKSYEDDDEKLFDAFISYKSDLFDESFVVKTLHPKLENELNFKLCLHYRDFVPGETIANNIIWAIQNSRRTILLVTPRYVESEWARMEYQKAQHEMLKRKHKIIPVILEDITEVKDTVDENLKMILETVTYVEWPGEQNEKRLNNFWKRLELNLPKKKKSEDLENVISENSNAEKESVKLKKYKHVFENGGFSEPIPEDSSIATDTFVDISLDDPPDYDSLIEIQLTKGDCSHTSRNHGDPQVEGDTVC